MRKGRKYNLNVSETMACGLGSYGSTIQCSILNAFSITCGTPQVTCSYPTITTEQLQSLSTIEYDERVMAFLDYIDVESTEMKEELYNNSTIDDPNCDIVFCLLNSEFLVYRFLTGVRVVNVGEANGQVQYRAYPDGANPDDYSWQTNGTFLELRLDGVYIFEVRDFYNNEEICKVSRIVSLPTLIPSTTITLAPKVARLYQISSGNYGTTYFKTGCIQIDPSLSLGEKIEINYNASATLSSFSSGSSCVHLTCKPKTCSTYSTLSCLTNTNNISPQNCTLTLCDGDVICYNVTAYACPVSYGATATARLCMTDVNGLGTIIPTIDSASCSTCTQSTIAFLPIAISLSGTTYTNPSLYTCAITGRIKFDPNIPNTFYTNVEFSAVTTAVGQASSTIYFATGTTTGTYTTACIVDSMDAQPTSPVIKVKGGQKMCYCMVISSTYVGSYADACMCIHNVSASYGLTPSIVSVPACKCISAHIETVPTPITVSICNQSNTGNYATGYINVEPTLPSGEYVVINYNFQWDIGTNPAYGFAEFRLCCKGVSSPYYMLVNGINSIDNPDGYYYGTGAITVVGGDILCYSLEARNYTSYAGIWFCLMDVDTHGFGIEPVINPDWQKSQDSTGNLIV